LREVDASKATGNPEKEEATRRGRIPFSPIPGSEKEISISI